MHPICQRLFAFVMLVAASALAADCEVGGIVLRPGPLDVVNVMQKEWRWSSGAAYYPAVTVAMQSGRFRYAIRHDRKYGSGKIGLSEPTIVNWYQSGMLELLLNGKRLDLLPANHETIDIKSGDKGVAVFSWQNDAAKVAYTFTLFPSDDFLLLRIDIEPLVEIKSVEVSLKNYVSGTNRKPQHVLHTPTRTLDRHGAHRLDPATENGIFYSDLSLDPRDNPKAAGPSALALCNAGLVALSVRTGGYGVDTSLEFKPDTRRIALAFWEFPHRPNDQALERFKAELPRAIERLNEMTR